MGTLFFDKGGKNTQWGKHCCCCYVASVVSDSVQSHRRQPTRLPRPWDSPGKNAGVGCHFLLQCMKVKSESEVTESCLTLSFPMKCSLPCSSVHEILQARILEWVAMSFSRGSSWPRDWTRGSCIVDRCFTVWATRELEGKLACACLVLYRLQDIFSLFHLTLSQQRVHFNSVSSV